MKAATPSASSGVARALAVLARALRWRPPAADLTGREPLGLLMQLGGGLLLAAQLYLFGAVLLADPWNVEELAPLLAVGALRSALHVRAGHHLALGGARARGALAAYTWLSVGHAAIAFSLVFDDDAALSLAHAALLFWTLLFWPATLAVVTRLRRRGARAPDPSVSTGWVSALVGAASLLAAATFAAGLLFDPAADPRLAAAALALTARAGLHLAVARAAITRDPGRLRRATTRYLVGSVAAALLVAVAAASWLAESSPLALALVEVCLAVAQLVWPIALWRRARRVPAPRHAAPSIAAAAEVAFGQVLLTLVALGATLTLWAAVGHGLTGSTAAAVAALPLETWTGPGALLELTLMAWAGASLLTGAPERRGRLVAWAVVSLGLAALGPGAAEAAAGGPQDVATPLDLLPLVLPMGALGMLAVTRVAGPVRAPEPPRRAPRSPSGLRLRPRSARWPAWSRPPVLGGGHSATRSYSNSRPALGRTSQSK